MSDKIIIRPQAQYKKTTYQVEYYDKFGKRRKRTEKTKLEAENFRQQLIDERNRRKALDELKSQGLVVDHKIEKQVSKDIEVALSEFYDSKKAAVLDPKDLRSLRIEKLAYNLFGQFIIEEQEREFVEEITLLDLEKFREKLQGTGIKNSTVVRKETSVNAFLNYCLAHKYVTENVALGLKKLPVITPKRKLYDSEEKQQLVDALPEWTAELFIVLEETMARPIEIERAKIGDINWAGPSIRVVSSKGNTVIERQIPLSEIAVRILRAVVLNRHLEKRGGLEDLIFLNSRGNPVTTDIFDKVVRNTRRKLGFPENMATPYALRHEGLNNLNKMNIPMRMIGSLAGHRKPETTMKYMQESEAEMRNVINLMEASKKKRAQVG